MSMYNELIKLEKYIRDIAENDINVNYASEAFWKGFFHVLGQEDYSEENIIMEPYPDYKLLEDQININRRMCRKNERMYLGQ